MATSAQAISATPVVNDVRSHMPDELIRQWHENGDWLGTTLGELMRDLARNDPERIVIIDKEERVSAKALFDHALQLASAMLRHGLKPGEVISYQIPNWWEGSAINIAASLVGVAVNPLVPIYRDKEIAFMLADVSSRMVFVPETFRGHDYAAMMRRVCADLPNPPEIVVLRSEVAGCISYADFLATGDAGDAMPAIDPDGPCVVMHTSGTTGRPKCVVHSHNTFLTQLKFNVSWMATSGHDVYLVATPISHIAGIIIGNLTIVGSPTTVLLMDIWKPDEAVQLIEQHGVTMCGGATPFLAGILSAAQAAGTHLPTLQRFGCGGAGVPPELIIQAMEWFPNLAAARVFGATEAPTAAQGAFDRSKVHHAAYTDGEFRHEEFKIVDPVTGEEIDPSQEGEILLRGPNIMLGYLHEEDNVDAFDADGFFRTGDLGRIVEGRYIVITGRKKDLIIRNGENLSPKEIEDALFNHPAVENVAVVGMPSKATGEAVCAFIIAKPGTTLDLPEVSRHLIGEGLAKQKIPERVVLVDTLPISPQGKVLKIELRDRAREIALSEAS